MLYNSINKLDTIKRLSLQMAEVLRLQDEISKDAFNTVGLGYEEVRENYIKERHFWNEGGPKMKREEDLAVTCRYGHNVMTRIHCPNDKDVNDVIFYIHGGGMVVGNNDTHSRIMRILAENTDAVVIGIDYSLAPEAVYPKAIHEVADVCTYYCENAQKYGINPKKIGFAGDSGGANLSMGATLYLRDNGFDLGNIKSLLLYYGAYGLTDSISMRQYGGIWDGLTEEDLKFYRATYLGESNIEEAPYYNCYLNDLTKNVPPCFIVGCELDPLVDDSKLLYTILKENNIDTEYIEYKGSIHAFLHYSKVMDDAVDALLQGARFFKDR